MKIRTIAIDDEPLALDLIKSYISKVPYLELLGTFHNPVDSLEMLKHGEVDLIYLDINMPDIQGIEFIRGLRNPPLVVFITAHENYALQGFEVSAVDYLLKPVSFPRFLAATEKVLARMPDPVRRHNFIFVKSEHNIIKIDLNQIHYIEGYKDYLKIHTEQPRPLLTITTLRAIEQILPPSFVRIHKSYIVSVDKILSFRNGKIAVKDKQLPLGDSYRDVFNKVVVEGRLT